MLKLLRNLLKTGDATMRYPFAPLPSVPGLRGKPEFAPKRCIACAACTIACPPNALSMETRPSTGKRVWRLNYGRCVFCARCEEVCPTGAIVLAGDIELAVFNKADLMVTAEYTLTNCRKCETPFVPTKEVDYVIELLQRSGMDHVDVEKQRMVYETCPDCRRRSEVSRHVSSSIRRMPKHEATAT